MAIQQRSFMKSASSGPPNRWWRFVPTLAVGLTLLVGGVVPASSLAATIQGVVFNDINCNGLDDDGDSSKRANETIFIRSDTLANAGQGGFSTATTNSDGWYSSSGHNAAHSFTMWARLPRGWTQTTPAQGMGMVFFEMGTLPQDPQRVDFGFCQQLPNSPPTAYIGNSQTVSVGDVVSFSADVNDPDGDNMPVSSWNFGDGSATVNNTLTTNHTFTVPGEYSVVFTVIDSQGNEGSANITVTVSNVLPTVNIDISTGIIQSGTDINFTGVVSDTAGDTHTYSWAFGDGSTSSELVTTHSYTFSVGTPTYTAVLTVTDNHGGVGTATVTVAGANTTPIAIAGSDMTATAGDTVSFNGNVTDADSGDSHTFVWDFGDGSAATSPSSSTNTSHAYTTAGTYTTTLTVTDNQGAVGADTLTVTVNGASPVIDTLSVIDPDTVITVGQEVNFSGSFTDADGGTHNFLWDFGDGNTATGSGETIDDITHSFLQSGEMTVVLKVTDSDGNQGTRELTLDIRGVYDDPCDKEPTIVSMPSFGNDVYWSEKDAEGYYDWADPNTSTVSINRLPNENDWVLVRAGHTAFSPSDDSTTPDDESQIKVKGLCIEQGATLRSKYNGIGEPPTKVNISVATIHNKGIILGAEGVDSSNAAYNDVNSYSNGDEIPGSSIKIIASKVVNAGQIEAGRGGNDLVYAHFSNYYGAYYTSYGVAVNAQSGKGGQVEIYPAIIVNSGVIQAGDGGDASTNNNANPNLENNGCCPDGNRGNIVIFSAANSGDGGLVRVQATNLGDSTNESSGQFVGGKSGFAFWYYQTDNVSGTGNGGSTFINLSNNFGTTQSGGSGTWSRWEPIVLKASSTTRFEGADNVVIFGGEDAEIDLSELSEGAISAAETITIAVGEGGVVDLPDDASGEVFTAGVKVEIFADKIRLDGKILDTEEAKAALTTLAATPNIDISPPKILYNAEWSYEGHIVGEPNTTVPVNLTLVNGGPTVDTYTISVSDSAGWNMGTLPATIAVNGLRDSKLSLNVTLPATRGEEDVITITATSQGDPDVQAIAEVRVGILMEEEVIVPRGDEKADITLVIDNTRKMGGEIVMVSNVLQTFFTQLREKNLPTGKETWNFLNQFDGGKMPNAEEMETFLNQFGDNSSKADMPTIELITFKDDVVSRVVTQNVAEVISSIRRMKPSGGDDCPNASVAALETALPRLNANGQIILVTAASPHKDPTDVIGQLREEGVKVSVLLAGSCGDVEADKALYKHIADETGGSFTWLPRGITAIQDVPLEKVISEVITKVVIPEPNQQPTAALAITPESGKAPLTVALDGSASTDTEGDIASYAWTASNGQTASGKNAELTFNEAGDYTITLEVTDNDGATAQVQKTVTVQAPNQQPTAALAITPESGKAPLTVALNGSASTDTDGNITSYAWSASNGQTASGKKAELTFNEAGDYTITLEVTDNDGATAQVQKTVTVQASNKQPTAAVSVSPTSGKAPLTVKLDGSASTDTDGNITSHAWTASNGQTADGQNAELTFNDAGKYTITLKVTDNDGATHSASSQQITVAKQGEYTAHGTLRDELGQPIVGAKVQIGDNTTTTDDAGNWAISGLQEGDDYTVKASKDGYTFAPENLALGNEVFKQNVTFKPVSALSVKVVAKPPVVKQDDNVTYTMTVINGGEETATNVALNSVLPAGTTLVSLEALDGGNCDTDTLSCTLSELATGGSARFKIVINNTQAKALVTQTTVTANEYPADVAKKWTRVIPYLSVSISDTPDPLEMAQAEVDRMLHYTLAVELSENAPSAATGVELVATLPQGVELQSVNSDYGMCDLSESPKLTCSMTDLSVDSADDISKVTLDVDVVLKDPGILVLTHEAKVTANEYPAHTDRERTKVFIPESVQVDIAFVIDDTGSMQGEINGVKKALIAFIEEIDTSEAPLSVLLTFGDEVKYRAVTQDMTVLRDAIGKLKASGGGTCPEASYEAISFAIPHVKKGGTILFATDASPYEGSDVEEMIVRLRNKGIIFNAMIFGDCSDENSWNEQPE